MFNNISGKYDFLNHFLSVGIDRRWRKKAISALKEIEPKIILDVATGTGDLALEAQKQLKPEKIIGIDIAVKMLDIGRDKISKKGLDEIITLEEGDSEKLPFEDNSFDAVIVAFGVRNFANVEKGLKMIQREGPPAGAPPRQEMPKIEPEQVDQVAKNLSAGKIDVRKPYNESNVLSFEDFMFEQELNELALTSAGVQGLIHAIYYNWDQIKNQMKEKHYFRSFRDVLEYIKGGDQEEQRELENTVKQMGVEILDMDDKSTWNLKWKTY